MSSTNKTTNYELSQFLGSDKPAWLVDYNGDMQKIDTQMKANAEAATAAQTKANTADGKADANATAIQTLDGEINGATGLASDVATLAGGLNTVTSLIGNGEPTTTDKTLIGAINEINGQITGTNYVIVDINHVIKVTADGVKTNSELYAELKSSLVTFIQSLADDEFAVINGLEFPGLISDIKPLGYHVYDNTLIAANLRITASRLYAVSTGINGSGVTASDEIYAYENATYTNLNSGVLTAGHDFIVSISIYKKNS